ncbi:MAG: hypothetical protein OXH78_03195 [Acidimicrobiaceae bacterium]|nr:hypothetical protein [Acidimicrobiaceae bacterium]
MQRTPEEAEQAIVQLSDAALTGRGDDPAAADPSPVVVTVKGVPAAQNAACRLSGNTRRRLAHRIKHLTTPEGRVGLILDWSESRGRVSSTEAADLTGLSRTSTNKLLTSLADEGHLEAGRPNHTGRGFFYTR